MKLPAILVLCLTALVVGGCTKPARNTNQPTLEPTAEPTLTKSEDRPMNSDSAWTWGYFFVAPDKTAAQLPFGARKRSVTVYRVDRVTSIKGEVTASVQPGQTLVRVESSARLLTMAEESKAKLLFQGVPQHLQYTTADQRKTLLASRAELPASKDTVAVIIPIRKSPAWWALAHDERQTHFIKQGDKIGHTAIGVDYIDRIYRKLYHTRYAVEAAEHDFITYFEFARKHEDDFKSLLAKLRDPAQNPEWNYVDREHEIWMTKLE